MSFTYTENSAFDNEGYYTGPETFGQRVRFGTFGDPGMDYGTYCSENTSVDAEMPSVDKVFRPIGSYRGG